MKTLISFFGIFFLSALSILACLTGFINNTHQMDTKQALDRAIMSTAKSFFLYQEINKSDFEKVFAKRFIADLNSSYSKIEYSLNLDEIDNGMVSAKVKNSYKQFNGTVNSLNCERTVILKIK